MKSYREPTLAEIALCAYGIYESEGRPQGKDREHWLQAEAQLIAERQADARQSTAKAAPKIAPTVVAAKPAPTGVATPPPAKPIRQTQPPAR